MFLTILKWFCIAYFGLLGVGSALMLLIICVIREVNEK